ncbi:hypothetical protein Tco_1385447 [Tanacetum coccineum]
MPPRRSEGEELEYPFYEGDSSSSDEWGDYGVADYERPPVFDDDQFEDELEEEERFVGKGFVDKYPNFQEDENNVSFLGVVLGVEEESMPIYDTDIEDVIEEEKGLVEKRGLDGEEDSMEIVGELEEPGFELNGLKTGRMGTLGNLVDQFLDAIVEERKKIRCLGHVEQLVDEVEKLWCDVASLGLARRGACKLLVAEVGASWRCLDAKLTFKMGQKPRKRIIKSNEKNNKTLVALMPILSVEDLCYYIPMIISVSKVVSSGWSFVSAVPGQMTYLVTSLTLDSARSYVM